MRLKRALVLVAILAIAIAGLPIRVASAPKCHSCCAEIAPCCQMAPASPSTPARPSDVQELSAHSISPPVHSVAAEVSTGVRPQQPLPHGCALHVHTAVLRI